MTNATNVLADREFFALLRRLYGCCSSEILMGQCERPEANVICLRPEIAHANQQQCLAATLSATSNTRRGPYWYQTVCIMNFIHIREIKIKIHSDATLTETYILIQYQQ